MEKVDIKPDFVFFPQPMYVIGTKNEDGSHNFADITWLGFSFDGAPCIMMTVAGNKLTARNIVREKAFSANLVTRDILWLADYLGSSKGENGQKNELPYGVTWGKKVDVPTLNESRWVYECRVESVTELDGARLFLARIENISIDSALRDMDLAQIDAKAVDPVIYVPYEYYAVGDKLGNIGEWKAHI